MNEAQGIDSLLHADLTNVDTSFPTLAAGVVACVIAEMAPGETKEKHVPVLNIKLTTAAPYPTSDGKSIKPAGFPLRDMVSLQPTEKYDPRQRLAQIKEAVFGEKTGSFGDTSAYLGKPVNVRIAVESSEEYGNQNRVKAYVRLAT